MTATLMATAPTLEAIDDAVTAFYCGCGKHLIPTAPGHWQVCWASDDEPVPGAIVRKVGRRYRFEVA